MRALQFLGASAILIALGAFAMSAFYVAPAERAAIGLSAIVALVIQMIAFAIAKSMARTNVIAGWGAGAVLRFVGLAVYALFISRSTSVPSAPATVALALFLFMSAVIEPLFLKT